MRTTRSVAAVAPASGLASCHAAAGDGGLAIAGLGPLPPVRASRSPETVCAGSISIQSSGPGKRKKGFNSSVASPISKFSRSRSRKRPSVEHPQVALPGHEPSTRLRTRLCPRAAPAPRRESDAHLPPPRLRGLAANQARHAEGEEQPVFVQKVQRDKAEPLAHIDAAGRGKSQRRQGNGEGGLRGLFGEPVRQRGNFSRAGWLRRIGHALLRPETRSPAQRQSRQRQPDSRPREPLCH